MTPQIRLRSHVSPDDLDRRPQMIGTEVHRVPGPAVEDRPDQRIRTTPGSVENPAHHRPADVRRVNGV